MEMGSFYIYIGLGGIHLNACIYGSIFGERDLLAIFHVMKTNLIAEKLPFQMLQTILKYSW